MTTDGNPHNCEIEYVDLKTNIVFKETFYDPYIYNVMGESFVWTGEKWYKGVSYGGTPLIHILKKAYPKNSYDPPKDYK